MLEIRLQLTCEARGTSSGNGSVWCKIVRMAMPCRSSRPYEVDHQYVRESCQAPNSIVCRKSAASIEGKGEKLEE